MSPSELRYLAREERKRIVSARKLYQEGLIESDIVPLIEGMAREWERMAKERES